MESCSSNLALALLFVTALATLQSTTAQNSPQDFVDPHNSARAAVGVGPVSWDDTVAAYAQNYANQRIGDCQLIHSGGPYGENIFWGSGRDYSAADAVNSWVSEKQYYDYNSNTCASGQVCGHYTQVVWANSVKIGCARVTCNSGAIFITCNYSPPGGGGFRGPLEMDLHSTPWTVMAGKGEKGGGHSHYVPVTRHHFMGPKVRVRSGFDKSGIRFDSSPNLDQTSTMQARRQHAIDSGGQFRIFAYKEGKVSC